MAYRPDPREMDRPLTKEQLEHYRYSLSSLAPSRVYAEYRRLHEECQMAGERLPKASSVQQLVTVWRFLRDRGRGQSVH
jgi:hypothetical protein